MKKTIIISATVILVALPSLWEWSGVGFCQNVGINATGAAPDTSAGLDIDFNDKGLLIPRLTTAERNAIVSPANSLLIFNTTTRCYEGYDAPSSTWVAFGCIGTCGSPFTDARDGKSYNTVLIGSQCWMRENLNYGTYTAVTTPQVAGTKFCQNLSGVNDPACPFGGLYEWANMMNGSASCNGTGAPPNDVCPTPVQGLCPAGWHVPSHYEWTTLEKNVGSNPGAFPYDITTTGVWLGTDEGGNLKQTGTTNWTTPNTGATNSSGFTALPGGYSWSGSFGAVGGYGYWWSATESGGGAWFRFLDYTEARVYRIAGNKANGFSCRCVKD